MLLQVAHTFGCFLFCFCSTVIMDISIERDWVPVVVPANDLSRVNSLMRRIDLITEGLLLRLFVSASTLLLFP